MGSLCRLKEEGRGFGGCKEQCRKGEVRWDRVADFRYTRELKRSRRLYLWFVLAQLSAVAAGYSLTAAHFALTGRTWFDHVSGVRVANV